MKHHHLPWIPLLLLWGVLGVSPVVPAAPAATIASPVLEPASNPVLLRAEVSLTRGDGSQAASIYEALRQKDPTAWEPLVGLATVAYRRFQYEQAESYLQQAANFHPEQVQVWAEMAHLYHHWSINRWKRPPNPAAKMKAQAALAKALQLGASHPLTGTYAAEAALDQGDKVLAERFLRPVLLAKPDYLPAMRQAARLYLQNRDFQRARNVLLRSLELAPTDSATYFLMAQLLQAVDRPAEAIQMAQSSENYDFGVLPDRDWLMAQEYARLGDTAKALTYYKVLNTYAPGDAQLSYQIARLRESQGQPGAAVDAYRQASRLDPRLLASMIEQAQTTTRSQPGDNALIQWRKILAIAPGDPMALHAVASLHYAMALKGGANPGALAADALLFQGLSSGKQSGSGGSGFSAEESALKQLDQLKLALAATPGQTPSAEQVALLQRLKGDDANHPLAAGEAAFLLKDYRTAQALWEGFDGQTADGYLQAGDRLLLERELYTSKLWYLRASQLAPGDARARNAVALVDRQKSAAEAALYAGDALLANKKMEEALTEYRGALAIDPQLVSGYIKQGEALAKTKRKPEALASYEQAVTLQPSLLSSGAFAKRYRQLGGRRVAPPSLPVTRP